MVLANETALFKFLSDKQKAKTIAEKSNQILVELANKVRGTEREAPFTRRLFIAESLLDDLKKDGRYKEMNSEDKIILFAKILTDLV